MIPNRLHPQLLDVITQIAIDNLYWLVPLVLIITIGSYIIYKQSKKYKDAKVEIQKAEASRDSAEKDDKKTLL